MNSHLQTHDADTRQWLRRLASACLAGALLASLMAMATATSAHAQGGSIDLSETAESTWQTNGIVHTILPLGDTVYIAGEFTNLNDGNGSAVVRNNLAAIDRVTGLPTSFDPNLNNKAFALTSSSDGATLYVGGSFTTASGVNRKRIAAFDTATGALTSFKPAFPNKSVRALDTDDTRLFIGGLFDKVGPDSRVRLAAYDIATQTLDPSWAPSADNGVKSLIVDPDKIWVAGNFEYINGTYAEGLGAVDPTTGALFVTDHPGFAILDIEAFGDQLFLAGAGPGGTALAYNRTTGTKQWSSWADGNVQGVAVLGDHVYFGGHYEYIGGTRYYDYQSGANIGRLARHDMATGAVDTSWLPTFNGSRSVNDVAASGISLYAGGDFTFVTGEEHIGFAMFADRPATEIPAELVSLTMLDVDQNGLVDTVEAEFDKTLAACAAPCTTGWTLTDAPSGAVLNSVSTSGAIATLQLTEGPEAINTAVGSFKVSLASPADISDLDGLSPTFAAMAPADDAAPITKNIWKNNAGTSGLAESGDSFSIKWSERIDPASLPVATDVVITDRGDGSNDTLAIAGLIDSDMDLGSGNYLVCAGGPCVGTHQATFATSAITLTSSGSITTVTFGSCSGDCAELNAGPRTTVNYVAPASVADVAGNSAVGSLPKTFKLF